MTIAVPICRQRVSPVLDAASRLLVITWRHGHEITRREFVLNPQPPAVLAASIAELAIDTLLCAAVSEPLLRELHRLGVRVHPNLCGEIEDILDAFQHHPLDLHAFRMPGASTPRLPTPLSKPSPT